MTLPLTKFFSRYRVVRNFLNEFPVFKIFLVLIPLFYTFIVVIEVKAIDTFSKMINGMKSSGIQDEAMRGVAAREAVKHLVYIFVKYLFLQIISGVFVYYNLKLYRSVAVYYLLKTLNIEKQTFSRMSSGEIKSILDRKANNIYKIIEYLFEKGIYHLIFVIYSMGYIYYKYEIFVFGYTIGTLVIFLVMITFFISKRNIIRKKYIKANAKTSADRFNILSNYDIIKAYRKEVDDVNSMDPNLQNMAKLGNISNFLSALTSFAVRVVFIVPNGVLYYLVIKNKMVNSLSTIGGFLAYNSIFCNLKNKVFYLREDIGKIGQYTAEVESYDTDLLPVDVQNTFLYFNYVDNRANKRNLFTNVRTLEHSTDSYLSYRGERLRVGYDITQDSIITPTRHVSEKSMLEDTFYNAENIETQLDPKCAFVFNNTIQIENLMLKANDRVLLKDINFVINRGEKIALVGKNGTGKSTFLDVLLRFKDYSGTILIDNVNMKDIYEFDQRANISYISQIPGIISGTVLDNLRYHDNSIPLEEIESKCEEYGYHETFSNLIDGYNTNVGENGRFLSGGQKQKISFMRGIIKNGDVFIMDEPTANLDPQSEIQIINHIFNKMEDKTVIMIVHKHNLLEKADKIVGIYNNEMRIYTDYTEFMLDSHLY